MNKIRRVSMKWWVLISLIIVLSFVLFVACVDDSAPPELSVTPVDMSTVTSFTAFGDEYSPGQKSPRIYYYVNASDVQVRSGVYGCVEQVFLLEGLPDYRIFIRVSEPWNVQYKIVQNVTVSVGDWVYVGDVLGTVGTYNRVELGVDNNFEGLSYCPLDYATESFINQHLEISSDWCLEDIISNP